MSVRVTSAAALLIFKVARAAIPNRNDGFARVAARFLTGGLGYCHDLRGRRPKVLEDPNFHPRQGCRIPSAEIAKLEPAHSASRLNVRIAAKPLSDPAARRSPSPLQASAEIAAPSPSLNTAVSPPSA